MTDNKTDVSRILDTVKAEGRTSLTAPEGKIVCDAYGITVPKEGLATSTAEAATIAAGMGFPVVLKIVSPEILHKTEAGGVLVGVNSAEQAEKGFATIMASARKYNATANLLGVQAAGGYFAALSGTKGLRLVVARDGDLAAQYEKSGIEVMAVVGFFHVRPQTGENGPEAVATQFRFEFGLVHCLYSFLG